MRRVILSIEDEIPGTNYRVQHRTMLHPEAIESSKFDVLNLAYKDLKLELNKEIERQLQKIKDRKLP